MRFNETRLRLTAATSGATAQDTLVTGDTYQSWTMETSGKQSWGAGSTALDTNLYRSAADTLKSDDGIWAAGGIVTKTKAGTPSDSDLVAGMQQSGAIMIDTTNSYLYVRVGSTWKRTAALV